MSSVPKPREPSKLEQVSNESSVLLSQGLRFFQDFPLFFGLGFYTEFDLLLDLIFHYFWSPKLRKIRSGPEATGRVGQFFLLALHLALHLT